MGESLSSVGTGETLHHTQTSPFQCKKLGFALALIVGIGALAVAGVGLGGYLHAGALSHLGQVNAVIMMAAGGGGGAALLIFGAIGWVKTHQKNSNTRRAFRESISSRTENARSAEAATRGGVRDFRRSGSGEWETYIYHEVKQTRSSSAEATARGQTHDIQRFGKDEWNRYFGDVGLEPPLPKNIDKIIDSLCPFFEGKSVKETHMLVLIPYTVDGEEFNQNRLKELVGNPKEGHPVTLDGIDGDVADIQHTESYWVLMTKDLIPKSKDNKTIKQQEKFMGPGYRFLKALEAATCMLMECVTSEKMLFEATVSYCAEKIPTDSLTQNVKVGYVNVWYFGIRDNQPRFKLSRIDISLPFADDAAVPGAAAVRRL